MKETEEIVFQNLFVKLRTTHFNTEETYSPVSPWKNRLMESYYVAAMSYPEQYNSSATYHLMNPWQEKRRQRIFDEERHAIDTSIESLRLLNIIIYNVERIERDGINLSGIIELGQYLRNHGHEVDYVKLDHWLKRLCLRRMASLISSILLFVFNFEIDELPFLYRKNPEVLNIIYKQIEYNKGNGKYKKTYSTMRYSPLSYIGNVLYKVKNVLNNIEE